MTDLMRAADLKLPSELRGAMVHRGLDQIPNLLTRLFRSFDGSLALRLWDGTTLTLGKGAAQAGEPPFTLVCHHPGFVRSMAFGRDPLRLAQAYFQGDIDVEGDFFAAPNLKNHLNAIRLSLSDRLAAFLTAFRLLAPNDTRPGAEGHRPRRHGSAVKAHSRTENRGGRVGLGQQRCLGPRRRDGLRG